MNLLQLTDRGIYCEQAGIYLDPWKKVTKAIITHGHADHAIRGHQAYICHRDTVPLLKARLGDNIPVAGLEYGETHHVNGVHFTLYPAGHILGSAQVKVEYQGEIWVYGGDYKVENDGISQPFEPVKCHTFITESTFALPVYSWENQEVVFDEINQWWKENKEVGRISVMLAYSLGKAQRLLKNLDSSVGKIYVHDSIEKMNDIHRKQGNITLYTQAFAVKWQGSGGYSCNGATGSKKVRLDEIIGQCFRGGCLGLDGHAAIPKATRS